MNQQYFITGTDTEVGKSFVTAALLKRAHELGHTAFGFKPIAAGAQYFDGQLQNEDGQLLQQNSNPPFDYSTHNPIVFEPPQSPHLCGTTTLDQLISHTLAMPEADYQLIEGAGGWLVPINEHQTLADYANTLNIPVIMVVDIKLGCINHALLTANAIGEKLVGWVANNRRGAPTSMIQSIAQRVGAPLLGSIGHCNINTASQHLKLPNE